MRTDISKINEKSTYDELTEGLHMYAAATSKQFNTGEWRTNTPVFNEEKCKQCLLCVPVCPDSSIPVENCKRKDFDYCPSLISIAPKGHALTHIPHPLQWS